MKENLGLPLPRLEIRWRGMGDYNMVADMGIVYTHFLGHIEFVPMSSTRVNGKRNRNELELPFRDSAHIWHDMEQMRIPGFVVNDETGDWAEIDGHGTMKPKQAGKLKKIPQPDEPQSHLCQLCKHGRLL